MTPPGLTCARCRADLYPHTVKVTDDGYRHSQGCTRACAVETCNDRHHAYGYCANHSKRWKKYGDPLGGRGLIDTQARLEDLRWMAESGEGLTAASGRIGESVKTIEAFLRRNDRDCLASLIAHEPKDHNRMPTGVSIAELTGLSQRIKRRRKVAA